MKKLLIFILLIVGNAAAQNFVTVTAANILNGSTSLLPSGTITFQAVGTNQQPISYQVGGGGQQILAPTICTVTNGAIVGTCLVANTLLTQPQNICFNVTIKTSSGIIVFGGRNSGYQCVQPVPNNAPWCTAGVCDFDNYPPNLPSPVLTINMPLPQVLTPGGIFAGDCSPGSVAVGYGLTGHPDCIVGTGGGSSIWGGITGTLANQLDLQTALNLKAPITSPAFLGSPTVPEPNPGDSSNLIANTLWVKAQGYAPLASPAFTGTPTAPTPLTADSSTKLATTAWVNLQGYSTGTGNVNGPGSSVTNDIVLFSSTNGKAISDAGFGFPLAPTNIGTLVAGQNGLANSATTDTTNANNISSGTLPAARLPAPSAAAFGGVKSYTAVPHQWLNSLSTAGVFAGSQPACSDLSNSSTSCSTDTTNASNISSGTLAIARLGTLVAGSNGLSNSATTDTTNASNISSGTLAIARLGTLVAGQNGLANSATTDTTNANNISSGTLAIPRLAAATFTTLTDGSTVTWAVGSNALGNAVVTIGGNRTLVLTGMLAGGYYTLKVIQDATGSRAMTLGSGCTWKVSNGGGGTITPTTTPGATDILAWVYDGTNCYANFAKNFN